MIRLQFVLAGDLASRAIAWWGQSTGGFSHVDAVLPSGNLLGARANRVGGQPPGVHIRPPNYERWVRRAVVGIPVPEADALAWQLWLQGRIGRPYDMGSIWGDLLGRDMHQPGHWICSALQTGALRHIGKLYPTSIADSAITPDSLYQMVTIALGASALVYL